MDYYAPGFAIRINHKDLAEQGLVVNQVTVDQSMEASARASFSLFRAGTEKDLASWLRETYTLLKVGAPVEVRAGYGGERKLIFKGCLTSYSCSFSVESVGEIQLEAQDYLFLLMKRRALRERRQGGFSQETDSGAVRRLLRHYPVFEKLEIEETGVRRSRIQQKDEEHDYQFLKRLAERNGFWLYGRLDQKREQTVFCFVGKPQGPPHRLKFGEDLRSFQPSVRITQVVGKVVVRGWDARGRKEIVGQAELSREERARLEENLLADLVTLEVHRPVSDQGEARRLAEGLLQRHRPFLEAEAEVLGRPEIQAGDLVKVEGLPEPEGLSLNRTYVILQATHQVGETGYRLRLKLKEAPEYVS